MKAIRWVGYAMVAAIGVMLSGDPPQGQAIISCSIPGPTLKAPSIAAM
jgi:hypothetical protein